MTALASPARQRGPAGTPPQPTAQRRAAVKSSPTGPRAARREAVPLDRHAKRSYPPPTSPERWVEKCDRSVANSETPQAALLRSSRGQLTRSRQSPAMRADSGGAGAWTPPSSRIGALRGSRRELWACGQHGVCEPMVGAERRDAVQLELEPVAAGQRCHLLRVEVG